MSREGEAEAPPGIGGRIRTVLRVSTFTLVLGVLAGCGGARHHVLRTQRATPRPTASSSLTTGVVSTVVASVPFAPVTAEVHNDCVSAARAVGYAVPCPTVLPLGMEATLPVHGCVFRIVAAVGRAPCRSVPPNGWLFGTGDVTGRGGGAPGFQHVILFAAPRVIASPARAVDGPMVIPESVHRRRGVVRVDGLQMTLYLIPMDNPSAFRGHLAMLWTERGHTYVYGFHVTATVAAARALDLELARHLRLVAP